MFDYTGLDGFYSLFRPFPADIVSVIIIILGILAILAIWRAVK